MTIAFFARGYNMKKENMHRLIGEWSDAKRGILIGYRLTFGKYSCHLKGGTVNIIESPGDKVYGVLYWITEAQMRKLDEVKRKAVHPKSFQSAKVKVRVNGKEVEAITHIIDAEEHFVKPSRKYLNTLIEGLKEHGYGESVIREIIRIANYAS